MLHRVPHRHYLKFCVDRHDPDSWPLATPVATHTDEDSILNRLVLEVFVILRSLCRGGRFIVAYVLQLVVLRISPAPLVVVSVVVTLGVFLLAILVIAVVVTIRLRFVGFSLLLLFFVVITVVSGLARLRRDTRLLEERLYRLSACFVALDLPTDENSMQLLVRLVLDGPEHASH